MTIKSLVPFGLSSSKPRTELVEVRAPAPTLRHGALDKLGPLLGANGGWRSWAARALLAATLVIASTAAIPAVAPSAIAPDFTLRTLSGSNLRLAEQRGQVVLVNFWATWCGPCRQEMPHLNRLYDKYRSSGFVLLGVNVDDDARRASDLAAKLALSFPVLFDTDKKVSRLYDMSAMPATLLIDRDGRVRYIHRGYREGVEAQYEQQIRELLKE